MCLIAHPLEPCSHYECSYFYQSLSGTSDAQLSPETLAMVSMNLSHQTALLLQLSSTNEDLFELIQSITASIRSIQASHTYATKSDFIVPEEVDLNALFKDMRRQPHAYSLQLASLFAGQISKERGFPLRFQVVDAAGSASTLPDETRFRLALYTAEPVPKLLTANISGKKALRGSTEALITREGEIYFPNIVVNEVSSHYYNEVLQLVVYCCTPSLGVRPFVMNSLQVRARRSNRW